jgi:hypothetical protein
MIFEIALLLIQEFFGAAILLASLVDKLVTLSAVINCILPLKVKLMALSMKALELFSGLVKLDLCGLSLCDLLLKLLGLSGHLNGQLFNVKGEFLDLGLISAAILLKSEVVLLLLSSGKSPLLELLLVPVHLKLELVHLLIGLEDHVLDVVQAILLVSHTLFKLLDLILEASTLPFGHLLQVLLRFNLLVLNVHEALSVNELHLN